MGYAIDLIYNIKEGNTVEAISDASWIIIDIIGIVIAGAANTYKTAVTEAPTYKGIMGGYEHQTSMLYDQWDFLIYTFDLYLLKETKGMRGNYEKELYLDFIRSCLSVSDLDNPSSRLL